MVVKVRLVKVMQIRIDKRLCRQHGDCTGPIFLFLTFVSDFCPSSFISCQDIYGKVVDIDIPESVFPTPKEIEEFEAVAPGCQHGWYQSVSKNDKGEPIDLHYRYWMPKSGKPKGIVIYTHGIHSHSGHGSRIDGRPLDVVS
jgi:hypothetical protein